jgi:hypothetical protein
MITTVNNISQLVLVMEKLRVYCHVGKEFVQILVLE